MLEGGEDVQLLGRHGEEEGGSGVEVGGGHGGSDGGMGWPGFK